MEKLLTSEDLREALVALTVGASGVLPKPDAVRPILQQYLHRALPGITIKTLKPKSTLAALNSISADVIFAYQGTEYDAFAKVHIESNTDNHSISSVAGVKEYENAALLSEHGWPVVEPLPLPLNTEYPILFYPRIEARTLFDLLSNSYHQQQSCISDDNHKNLKKFEIKVGLACLNSLRAARESKELLEAPAQSLFLSRIANGGRIDQWYFDNTIFRLPGLPQPLRWSEICQANWTINEQNFSDNLHDIIKLARQLLSYRDSSSWLCVSHGDDHGGNIFILDDQRGCSVFDPAFAGWNPAALAHVKAFMHSGILPLAGLYYDPKLEICKYSLGKDLNTVNAEISFNSHFMLLSHCIIARNIVDYRIIPLFRRLKELGADIKREYDIFKAAMITCCLLVIRVDQLLTSKSNQQVTTGSGEALLALAVMCSECRGLPQLEYLDQRIMGLITD